MEAKASLQYGRIGPRKVRVILDQVKGRAALEAVDTLENLSKKSADMLLGVLNSAISNAKEKGADVNKLVIKEIRIDGGPSYKRALPRAMGSVHRVLKRTTHMTVILTDEIELKRRAKKGATQEVAVAAPDTQEVN